MNGVVSWTEAHKAGKAAAQPHYLIEANPHVMTRLKRVFAKVNATQHGLVALVDSPENSVELLWFMDRYPMDTDAFVRARLEARAEVFRARERMVQDILFGRAGATQMAITMALPPRQYQQQAADLACATGRLLLADDVGLGKTASAITALCKAGKFPVLVVTLTHLPRQWQAEINRFAPELSTYIIKWSTPTASNRKPEKIVDHQGFVMDPCPNVIICSYSKLHGWAHTLSSVVQGVVFDEVQELRKSESQKYAAGRSVVESASLRMGLSATPFYNYGGEMFNVLSVLQEDCLGTREEFHREWCGYNSSDDKARIKDPKAFGTYLRDSGLMLRRTREDVGRELPGLQTVPHYIDADESVINEIAGSAAELARRILQITPGDRSDRWRASGEFDSKMRQATGLAKAPYVADFVQMLVESGEKVVLFGWHKAVYALWREKLKDLNPAFYTGSETQPQKQRELDRFMTGDAQVFIVSLRAGAGLDGLQKVSRVCVFGELDWSPGVHVQCQGRVARDGQMYPVTAYYLLAETGADPIMTDVLGVKRGQIDGVSDPNAELVEASIDPDHIKRLAESFLRQKGELAPEVVAPAPVVLAPAPTPAPAPKPTPKPWTAQRVVLQPDLFETEGAA